MLCCEDSGYFCQISVFSTSHTTQHPGSVDGCYLRLLDTSNFIRAVFLALLAWRAAGVGSWKPVLIPQLKALSRALGLCQQIYHRLEALRTTRDCWLDSPWEGRLHSESTPGYTGSEITRGVEDLCVHWRAYDSPTTCPSLGPPQSCPEAPRNDIMSSRR